MTTTTPPPRKPSRPKLSPKDEVRALLDRLPDTVTLEDIQYHLDVVVKVLEAEASLERGEGIPHEEVFRGSDEQWRARVVWCARSASPTCSQSRHTSRVTSPSWTHRRVM